MTLRTVLLTGGTRSGKSALAQRWAEAVSPRRVFIATARVEDAETAQRVRRHQQQRGAGWEALEAPRDVLAALDKASARGGAVVLDCVTMWLSNMMADGASAPDVLRQVAALAAWLERAPVPAAVVTAELGSGIVPMSALGREFRDVQGEANQLLAAACRHVVLVACGLPLSLKGGVPEEWRCE